MAAAPPGAVAQGLPVPGQEQPQAPAVPQQPQGDPSFLDPSLGAMAAHLQARLNQ